MNSSRKIDISKSSLVSLRAELARKQDEVLKAKAQSQAQFIRPLPKPKKETIFTKKNNDVDSRNEMDAEEKKEEEDVLKKSRAALESKSKLYDQLSKNSECLDEDDVPKYLVDFHQKEKISHNDPIPGKTFTPIPITNLSVSDDEGHISDDEDIPSDPEEDWVDYVDCLNRTRRCLRRDLPSMKAKDKALSGTTDPEPDKTPIPAASQLYVECKEGDVELLSDDMRREIMREKWEQQEKELQDRTDIHYQDVLFDEARSHGVSYYGFSGDEVQRAAQQAALNKLRSETKNEQETTRAMRERRQKQLEARLKAARQRQRIKLGLLPEEDEPATVEPPTEAIVEVPAPLPRTSLKEKTQKGPHQVRPWDVGKEGVTETNVMSQEEWTSKCRKDRNSEFAPPTEYSVDRRPTIKRAKPAKRKFTEHPTPIVEDELPHTPKPKVDTFPVRKGAEIAPPPTFEYYGPSSSKRNSDNNAAGDLENSIMAGLKYLRQQAEQKENVKEKGLLDIV